MQVTKVRGPIWLDNKRAAAGSLAQPQTPESQNNISPIGNQNPEIQSVTGQMHGGVVSLDAQMNSGPIAEFFVQASLSNGSLAAACRDFSSELKDIEGSSFASIRMTGDYTGTHSHRGEGAIQLRDAKIYELPVFLSLLKILKIRQITRTAFDSSNIDFSVEGETFIFNRMEFLGDAISLIGDGKMNLDWDIDLNFYSVMGRNRFNIPLISELYRASSQKILWINVNGTLDNPQTHRNVFSGLNELSDSLRQLLQPRRRGENDQLFGRPGTATNSYQSNSARTGQAASTRFSPNFRR